MIVPGRVSLITAVYNKEKFLANSIEHSLAMKYHDFELIIVNDGSTDRSLEIIQFYARNSRVRVINQSNAGSPTALRNGVMAATGEFFIRCDADDWEEPNFIEETMPRMAEKQVGAVCTHTMLEGDVHRPTMTESFGRKGYAATIKEEMIQNWLPNGLVRMEAYNQTPGFNPAAGIYSDWNLWIDITKRGWKIALVDKILHHYRITYLNDKNCETSQIVGKHEENFKRIRSLHPDLWPDQPDAVCKFCGESLISGMRHECPYCPFCGIDTKKFPNHECEPCRCGECGNLRASPHDASVCQRNCGFINRAKERAIRLAKEKP